MQPLADIAMQSVGSSGEFGNSPVLVTGVPERSRERAGWRESMTGIIRGNWSRRKRSARTEAAEAGFGILGTPHYFYAMRTERAFGVAVFFFRETRGTEWPEGIDGATPFDSGGLWHGKVRTSPPADRAGIREIFRIHREPLASWTPAFYEYVAANHSSISEYIEGAPPSTGTDPIVPGLPNSSRAWTWEVRIPNSWMNVGVELLHGFLSEDDRQMYLNWLWDDSGLDDGICDEIEEWMLDNMTYAPGSLPASTVAERTLLGAK